MGVGWVESGSLRAPEISAVFRIKYTHVCRLCWPQGTFDSDDNPSEASPAGSGDEELEDDNASSWVPLEPPQQGWEGYGDSLERPNPAEWEG